MSKLSQHQLVLEGRIVDLDSVYESRIGIDGRITEINPNAIGKKILHLEKYILFPGFIDTHAHFRVPVEKIKKIFIQEVELLYMVE